MGPLLLAGLYLVLLFLVGWAAGRTRWGARFMRHPVSYVLALGIYTSSWSYFGHVGMAESRGAIFLTTHIGMSLAMIVAPAMWGKVLTLTREHQLASVADLFAFRYRSRGVGLLVTLVSLAASLPYLAQQVRAVVGSYRTMTGVDAPVLLGLGFSATLALVAILFGTRDVSPRVQSDGLRAAIAFESLVKLTALILVGAAAVAVQRHWNLEHPSIDAWLAAPSKTTGLPRAQIRDDGLWSSLLLLSFTTAFLMPRQFHVAFAEGTTARSLRFAAWAFPLYLLLFNLPVLSIAWLGSEIASKGHGALTADADYYVITVAHASGWPGLEVVAFLGGVSAASAMMLVTLLALSAMCMNYVVSPSISFVVSRARWTAPPRDLRLWLRRGHGAWIVALAFASWSTFRLLDEATPTRGDESRLESHLIHWGYDSFVAIAQLFPGLVGVLFWRRATARGLVAGLAAGVGVWIVTIVAPRVREVYPSSLISPMDPLAFATFTSLLVNALLFGAVSLLLPPRPGEEDAAATCIDGAVVAAAASSSPAHSRAELRERLARLLGERMAEEETDRAARSLELGATEASPRALRRLGERVEQNLSGMMGPLLARIVVRDSIAGAGTPSLHEELSALDEHLAQGGADRYGIAAELAKMRRFLGALLDDLPVGVCALDHERRIVIYNRTMEGLTGVEARTAEGSAVTELPSPWGEALGGVVASSGRDAVEMAPAVSGRARWLRVLRSTVDLPAPHGTGLVLLVEDTTERRGLEARVLHQDRVATIGYLAAGLAHGIKNPLAGISSIAQNVAAERDLGAAAGDLLEIVAQVERIDGILQSLLHFGKPAPAAGPAPTAERVAVRGLVEGALGLLRLYRIDRRLEWENRCAAEHTVLGDPQQIEQVLVNVLTNAADASPERGTVIVESEAEDGHLVLRIVDEGPGPSPELGDRVFEPFVTTKAAGSGSGLGLYIARDIVHNHRGTIRIERQDGARTVVRVRLPTKEGP